MRRLTHGIYGITYELEENFIYEIVVEHPTILTELVKELLNQTEGGQGEFRLSKGEKILPIDKNLIFVNDIFSIEINQRKVLTKLYAELSESAYGVCLQEKGKFNEAYIRYMDAICGVSDLFIMYEDELDIQELFKVAKVKIDTDAVTLLETLIEYIKVVTRLLRIDVFVFLNLKFFLTQDELLMLYEECFNRKVCLILVESVFREKLLCEKGCIIDKDKCIIYF